MIALDLGEVLRYSGFRGGVEQIDDQLKEKYHSLIAYAQTHFQARRICRVFPINHELDGIRVCGTPLILTGKSVAKLLDGCTQCALIAMTLGAQADRLLAQMQVRDMLSGVILDACATEYLEKAADDFCAALESAFGAMTGRFSPGYGDLPLQLQKTWLNVLNAGRMIGLTTGANSLLVPQKSITAVMGLKKEPNDTGDKRAGHGCAACDLQCAYRKETSH